MPGRLAVVAFYGTGAYDPATNLTYWGSAIRCGLMTRFRPGDNLFTNSAIAFNAGNGKITWWHQYTPNDNRDYDETGSHILIDTKINGEDRKIVSHAGRNGFTYSFDRLNGQFLKATQHVKDVTWTKGIDPKTGKPIDYNPGRDVQFYAEGEATLANGAVRRTCPTIGAAPISGRCPIATGPATSTSPPMKAAAIFLWTPAPTSKANSWAGDSRRTVGLRVRSRCSIRSRENSRSVLTSRIRIRQACCRPAAVWCLPACSMAPCWRLMIRHLKSNGASMWAPVSTLHR